MKSKLASNIAGVLLGLLFLIFGLNFFFQFIPMPADPSPDTAPHKMFMAAMFSTGYLTFVKILEIVGGILVAVPRTRNLGLLVLGPIVVNILAFHVFLTQGAGLFEPPVLLISVLSAFLLWSGRKAFAGLAGAGR